MGATKFHTHTEQQAKLYLDSIIFYCVKIIAIKDLRATESYKQFIFAHLTPHVQRSATHSGGSRSNGRIDDSQTKFKHSKKTGTLGTPTAASDML